MVFQETKSGKMPHVVDPLLYAQFTISDGDHPVICETNFPAVGSDGERLAWAKMA
jgi:hypothetical protein